MATTGRRILHVITSPMLRGAQRFALDLSTAMAAQGADTELVALEPSGSQLHGDVEVLGTDRWSVATLRALRSRARSADIVIAHGSATLNACAIATAGLDTPFIYRLIGDPRYWTSSLTRRARVGIALHRAGGVVTYFPDATEELRRRYRLAQGDVTTIAKGIDLDAWPAPDDEGRVEARRVLDIAAEAVVVGFVGALSAEKRPALAMQAAMAVPGCMLLVAGDGPLRAEIESAASSHGARVRFLGETDDPRDVYLASDVILSTSATEGVPGVLVEAALCEVPCVASHVGGVAQVVRSGTTGFIVDDMTPNGFTLALTGAIAERDRMGRAAREVALEEFDIGPVAARWLELVEKILRTTRHRRS